MNQCVRQKMLVVALGEVGSLVRAAGFFAAQSGFDDCLRDVEHPRQLEQRRQLGIERVAVIVDPDLREAFLQHPELEVQARRCGPSSRTPPRRGLLGLRTPAAPAASSSPTDWRH